MLHYAICTSWPYPNGGRPLDKLRQFKLRLFAHNNNNKRVVPGRLTLNLIVFTLFAIFVRICAALGGRRDARRR
jgi:hypothetical protein